jgi:hypothetical protein
MARELPDRQGQAWPSKENEELRKAFLAGEATRALAVQHQRTPGAIRSRLKKLGLISAESNAQEAEVTMGVALDRIAARIPAMSSVERQNLRANCKRMLSQGSDEQKSSAIHILALLNGTPASRESGNSHSVEIGQHPSARPEFIPDKSYEGLPGVMDVLQAVDSRNPAVLVLGRAGTGKTTLIRYLRQRPGGDAQAIVAPTGIAAQNATAQTIHSFFQLPPVILNPDQLPDGKYFGPLFKKMTRLVIDEISMVRADLLDAIDIRLQKIRENAAPFGGVQVLMVGDFLQLPPVVQDHDWDILRQLGYKTPFAFSARVFQRLPVTKVSLDRVFRQNEQEFIDILGKVRSGIDLESTVRIINERCVRPHREGALPLLLTSTLAAAERYNQQGLERLKGDASIFAAEAKGKPDGLQIPQHLELKPGARVMATRNDTERRWINGSLGTVSKISGDDVYVKFDRSDDEYHVEPVKWEKIRQVWNNVEGRIENQIVGTYEQLPLTPAWAITIHKAQGLTLDDVRIDFGAAAFAQGQVYVALSRVRTLAGLSLTRPLRASDFVFNPLLKSFLSVNV